MNLRTTFPIKPSENKLNYNTPVMFIGSCFASEIGFKMSEGKMKVLVNPTGVVYNPVSAGNTIDIILEDRVFSEHDLYKYKGLNISFAHNVEFSSENSAMTLGKINIATSEAHHFLKSARFLFISFGTARVYRFTESGKIVANCHKLPSALFSTGMLTVEEITSEWNEILDRLHSFNNDLSVIFTVSPVRHWKDGAHGNQVSKSILFLAVENLLGHKNAGGYFPAYELVMDDLRDYRYYAQDMLHPSQTAVEYIWEAFSECYFDNETTELLKEVQGISKAINHRFLTDSPSGKREFANNILKKISQIEKRNSQIDFTDEKTYFLTMISE